MPGKVPAVRASVGADDASATMVISTLAGIDIDTNVAATYALQVGTQSSSLASSIPHVASVPLVISTPFTMHISPP